MAESRPGQELCPSQAILYFGISLLVACVLEFFGVSPIKALVFTAIAYGLTAPVIIVVIMHIGNNKKIMNDHTNSWLSNLLGGLTFLLMAVVAVAMIYFLFK